MRDHGPVRISAACAGLAGTVALVTGSSLAAVVAGAASLATSVLASTRRPTVDVREVVPPPAPHAAIDLRRPVAPAPGANGPPVDAVVHPASPLLLDDEHLASALRNRVAVARRALRPLSVVHILILDEAGTGPVPAELIAAAAESTLRESDIVGRTQDGVYVVVLEDTGEDGAVWTTERLRRHIAGTIGTQRFQAGVASYPSHGLDAETIDIRAADALRAAQEWNRDRIEVAAH